MFTTTLNYAHQNKIHCKMFSPSPLFIGSTYFLKLIAALSQMKKNVLISIILYDINVTTIKMAVSQYINI